MVVIMKMTRFMMRMTIMTIVMTIRKPMMKMIMSIIMKIMRMITKNDDGDVDKENHVKYNSNNSNIRNNSNKFNDKISVSHPCLRRQ